MQASQDSRIRGLLYAGVVRAQLLAICSWVVVQTLTMSQISLKAAWVAFLAMAAVFALQTFTRSDRVWRFSGLVFVIAFVASYKLVFIEFEHVYAAFSLPFAVITVLGASLLIRNAWDYFVIAIISWIIVWPHVDVAVSGASRYVLIFALFSLALGWVNHYTYIRSLRNLLTLEAQYRVMAETDFLTGILNRRALIQRFEHVLGRSGKGFFLMLDVDNFKRVNDQWGHDVGDQVLCALARCMESLFEGHGCGRMGGEEFGVVLDTADEQEALDYANKLLLAVRSIDSLPVRITVSAGLVGFKRGNNVSEVLRDADTHLYFAKRSGKDNVKYCKPESEFFHPVF